MTSLVPSRGQAALAGMLLLFSQCGLAKAQVLELQGVFAEPDRATASADIALDASGGVHVGYRHYEPTAEGAQAAYATCRGACTDFADWQVALLAPAARRVQVAVTPDGAPRLLIETDSQVQAGGVDYLYAACDAGCGEPGNWSSVVVATSWDTGISTLGEEREAKRSFVLDGQGRPRFLYSDRNYLVEPDHYGTFYMSCEADCTDAAHWEETDLARHSGYDTEIFDAPVLALTPEGAPRVVARVFAMTESGEDAGNGLYFLACDGDCTEKAAWSRAMVVEPGSGSYPSPTWDLAIDAQGRPRVALFSGDGMEPAELSHSLIYLWCEAECLDGDAWSGAVVAPDGHGEQAALALDDAGHPRLAFRTAGGDLAWGWCDVACETSEGAWSLGMVETQEELSAVRPTALPFTCDGELWEALGPQLVLAWDGRFAVAYDVAVQARCLYKEYGRPEVTYDFHELWRGVRVVGFRAGE